MRAAPVDERFEGFVGKCFRNNISDVDAKTTWPEFLNEQYYGLECVWLFDRIWITLMPPSRIQTYRKIRKDLGFLGTKHTQRMLSPLVIESIRASQLSWGMVDHSLSQRNILRNLRTPRTPTLHTVKLRPNLELIWYL